jgi:hypothetical protein
MSVRSRHAETSARSFAGEESRFGYKHARAI